ncbi:Protein of unknown function [Gryllus bimaculatus]|nr:Protein of unknown function [Gryllus bimaculatus]
MQKAAGEQKAAGSSSAPREAADWRGGRAALRRSSSGGGVTKGEDAFRLTVAEGAVGALSMHDSAAAAALTADWARGCRVRERFPVQRVTSYDGEHKKRAGSRDLALKGNTNG